MIIVICRIPITSRKTDWIKGPYYFDAILITDMKSISEVNPAFAGALGYLTEEMKGRSILDFAPKFQEDGILSSDRRDEVLKEIYGGRRINVLWKRASPVMRMGYSLMSMQVM
ncbi:PAS domain-containing protein [Methanogenium marinum]|uniref:PAS domain-containing protein n=1 Tax=Methanogenium marinum TaxID=348610 RepID=A0A9Q4PXB1_9EURY|nr:PAS domain-containing protein [Methanogenium marinum]MDE4908426.1 PAS domain-containing protein [Methanogenium marinum]